MSVIVERLDAIMDRKNPYYLEGLPYAVTVDISFACRTQEDYNELLDALRALCYFPDQPSNQTRQFATKDVEPVEIVTSLDDMENNSCELETSIDIEL